MDSPNFNPTDEELAKCTQAGDIEQFGVLVERYEQKILRYGRKFLATSNSLEDTVQEIFLKAYRNIRSFDTSKKFSSWLYRIAHNEFINELKKNTRHPFAFMDPDLLALHPSEESPPSELEKQEVLRMLEFSLRNLDDKYREVLILYFEEEFSYQEIADILHIPIATVGIRLQRGKAQLKKLYKNLEYHGPQQ